MVIFKLLDHVLEELILEEIMRAGCGVRMLDKEMLSLLWW